MRRYLWLLCLLFVLRLVIEIAFACKPELCDTLVLTAQTIVEDMAANGPTEEEFNMTVLNLKKNIPEKRIGNAYWINLIKDYSTGSMV